MTLPALHQSLHHRRLLLAAALLVLPAAPAALAQDPTGAPEIAGAGEGATDGGDGSVPGSDPGSDPATRIDCLDELSDEGYRRKGVQRRDFLKRNRFEISALGGFYASDVLSSTYTAGGSVAFFPAEDFGIELLGHWSPVRYRLDEAFSSFDKGRRFEDGSALSAMVGLLFSPFHTKLKLTETRILHGDLVLVAGAGRTFHDSVQGIGGQLGIGLRVYLGQRFGLRLDARDFILSQEVLGRGRVSHNVGLLLGLGLWL